MALYSFQNNRLDIFYTSVAFLGSLVVYILTLCPTVYLGDSGEFITNALTLGINHPTGYSVYTLLGRVIVTLLPFADTAYAVNLLSAICAALTVSCLYLICRIFTEQRELALACSLAFAFSLTFWSRATVTEVYTLNALFIALSFLFMLRWYFSQQITDLVILAYLIGLGLSQHVTAAIIAPFIVLLIFLRNPRIVLDLKLLTVLVFVAVLGFSSYLYLPIRTNANPPLDWGNPNTIDRIIGHFLPKGGDHLFGETTTSGGYGPRISWIFDHILTKEYWFFGALSVLGVLFLALKHWRIALTFVGIMAFDAYFTVARKLPFHADFDAYFIPSFMIMALFLCIAANSAWELLLSKGLSVTVRRTLSIGVFVFPALLFKSHYYESDKSNTWFAYDFGKNMLAAVPQNAVLFTVGDEQSFLSWYFKYVAKEREDIIVVDRSLLGAVWGSSHMYNRYLQLPIDEKLPQTVLAKQITSSMMGQRPVFVTPRLPWDFMLEDYDNWHHSMAIELLPKGAPVPDYQPTTFTFHPDWEKQYFDERTRLIVQFYVKEYIDNARFWYVKGNKDATLNELAGFYNFPDKFKNQDDNRLAFILDAQVRMDRKQYQEATAALDSAEQHGGATDFRLHDMRGNVSFLQQDTAAALKHWKLALAYNPENQKIKNNIEFLTRQREMREQFQQRPRRNRPGPTTFPTRPRRNRQ